MSSLKRAQSSIPNNPLSKELSTPASCILPHDESCEGVLARTAYVPLHSRRALFSGSNKKFPNEPNPISEHYSAFADANSATFRLRPGSTLLAAISELPLS